MKQSVLFTFVILLSFHLHAADYYWVGGAGNWTDLNHWRLGSSGGSIPSIVPASGDNVFFDAGSGFTPGNVTVTLNSSGFCNNMTWNSVANNPRFITSNIAFGVQLNGSLVLSPTTTYNVVFTFVGATAATLTTNGNVLGEFGMNINKPSSSLTVTDNLIVPALTNSIGTNVITFTTGTFDITGKKMTIYQLSSDNNNVRSLLMANADVTVNYAYHYTGTGKTLNAAGSNVLAYGFWSDGGTYNKVTSTSGNGPNTIDINNSTFSSLTFSPSPGSIYSDIANGNTIDTLVFNGTGTIGSNNTIVSIRMGLGGTISGTGNVIRSIRALDNFMVAGNYINTVDSVVLAPNHITTFRGTFNINKYLYVAGAACEAFTEINGDSTVGTVNFAPGAVADISNVILVGIKATGAITPIAVNGLDGTGNAGFTFTEPSTTGTTLYWVGGAGDWNNRTHWSTSSGGAGGACVPFINDNVIFDGNSGLTGGGTVTTSSSSLCKDLTWASGVGTVTFNESATSSFRVYGSVVLQSTVTVNGIIELYGSNAANFTTNGGGKGSLQVWVVKTGGASVTLTDDWSNPTIGILSLASGNLSMTGRTVSLYMILSSGNAVRSLDISNATITVSSRWVYYGGNKTLNSTGSHITSSSLFQVNSPASTYPWVDLTYGGTDNTLFDISGTTFGQLTFTSASATSAARILGSNTIRRLEFKGSGFIANTNNNIDSLILAGSRNYLFSGTNNTIIKYLKAQATPCSGLTEMRGYNGVAATLAFPGTAELHIDNVYMQNMKATGPLTPITFNGADAGGNTGWTINSAAGAARYWVGGSGDWNDLNHWSATSGGATGACVPTVYDDVYFNAGSGFTAGSKTVTVNNGNAYFHNIDWTGATNAPVWSKAASWTIEVWGNNVILNPTATFNATIVLKGTNAASLQGTVLGNFDIYIDKPGSSLTLFNNISNTQVDIGVLNGSLNASGRQLNVSSIDNTALNNVTSINISNSNITTNFWRYTGTLANHTLNAAGSSLTTATIYADGLQYDTVKVSGTLANMALINGTNMNRLTFTNPSTTSTISINGSNNTFGTVEYKGSGGIGGSGNAMDTLVFFPGSTYTLTAGSNTTINDAWYGSGTPCRPTEVFSSSSTVNATITQNNGHANFDYVRLRRITAAGTAAPFAAASHSTDLGNNVNWNIAPYNGAAPIAGLGTDTAVLAGDFPIVLHTNGFFGAPGSQFTWNDNSTADTLLVTAPGTYSVAVSFPDGCSINDAVIVSLNVPLPITLESFNVKVQDCQPLLSWKVAEAINFSRFVIEQSKDGRHFTSIGQVPYSRNVSGYSYSYNNAGSGISFYRLKLMDIDGKYEYSAIESIVRPDCGHSTIEVYPTVTSNSVKVVLPQGYEKARLYIVTIAGQQIAPVVHGSGLIRTIDMHSLPAATYMLQVINGSEMRNFKVIRQ